MKLEKFKVETERRIEHSIFVLRSIGFSFEEIEKSLEKCLKQVETKENEGNN